MKTHASGYIGPPHANSMKSTSLLNSKASELPAGEDYKYVKIPKGMPAGKFIGEHVLQSQAKLFHTFYPRMYNNLADYHSPKEVAGWLSWAVLQLINFGVASCPSATKLVLPALGHLVEKAMPTFFLDRSLLDAVKRTDFHDDIDWVNLKLPFEHGVMILPRGALNHPTDGDVSFIVWSRCTPGSYPLQFLRDLYPGPSWKGPSAVQVANTTFAIVAMTHFSGIWYDSCLSTEHRPTLKLNNLFYRTEASEPYPDNSTNSVFDEPLGENDREFIEQLGVVVFGTLMAMLARPSLLSEGKREGKPVLKDGFKKEWWTPNIIGKGYAPKQGPSDGTHASPRMHWRRGHFRQQVHGAGRALRKQIWLEPMLVNAEVQTQGS